MIWKEVKTETMTHDNLSTGEEKMNNNAVNSPEIYGDNERQASYAQMTRRSQKEGCNVQQAFLQINPAYTDLMGIHHNLQFKSSGKQLLFILFHNLN